MRSQDHEVAPLKSQKQFKRHKTRDKQARLAPVRVLITLLLIALTSFEGFAKPTSKPASQEVTLRPASSALPKEKRDADKRDADKRDADKRDADKRDADTWNVAWRDAPSHSVMVDTHEGTWMSVDVSPDGAWVVFDMLGDIYRVPINGGEAEPLRVGHAWEMQPRYSPDGQWIAFTSDLGGGDNIWVMPAEPLAPNSQSPDSQSPDSQSPDSQSPDSQSPDSQSPDSQSPDSQSPGSQSPRAQPDTSRPDDPKKSRAWPVSKESYRLVNSPTWTPDGRAIIGRKHFTSRRSLGAGEMWRYHWRGGHEGIALTKKQSEQKDEGEPALSPDGRWLYYSQDLSAGERFEYNKDSHRGIYGIRRLNLETRELITLTGGPGGAARPTPSPDGRSLAFIRRVAGRTALWIRDLKSGGERMVDARLERDLQETWAVHGVYPQIAWTPDSQALVFWAMGKLWKLNLKQRTRVEIPFHVQRRHRLIKALRASSRVAESAHMPVRMLRWVRRHGRRVMFQALGHIYLLDLDDTRKVYALPHHHAAHPPPLKSIRVHTEGEARDKNRDTHKSKNTESKNAYKADSKSSKSSKSSKEKRERRGAPALPKINHRAPSAAPRFALSPSWSADGRQVIYTTWHDQHLGQIRVFDLETGEDEELSRGPGHYLNPLLSADEEWLVYQRVGGGWITSPRYAHKVGLYALNLSSGREVRIAHDAHDAHWGPDSRRVYYTRVHKKKLQLLSTPLSLTPQHLRRPQVIAEGEKLQLIRIAPRGGWVAFQSDFSLWVSALPPARAPLQLSTKSKDRPLFLLSEESGFDPQWSRDGARISWSLGSTLYEARLPLDLLARPPHALSPKQLKAQQASRTARIKLELSTPRARPQGAPIALIGGRILTMQSGRDERADLIERGIVIIEGERIVAVGSYDDLIDRVPDSAHRINAEGHTIIPGLIDVHAHGPHTAHGITPQANWHYGAELAFGVTTTHDPSHHSQSIFTARELVESGQAFGPRIFSTGTILYGADGPVRAEVKSLADARRHLKRMQALGAFSVKSYNQPRREQRQQILTAARELGMLVVPEGGSLFHHNMNQLLDGHTGIEHAIPLKRLYADVIQLWAGSEVGYTPTLNVAYGGIMGENYWYQESRVYEHTRLRRFVPSRGLDARARRPFIAPHSDWNHIDVARSARDLMRAGVRVHAGAHGQREGLGMHWEMWSMAQGGFTPYEALRAATLHGAMYLGLDQDLGRIRAGALADLAVIRGDVLRDLRLSERVAWVIRGGQVYDASTLARLAPTPAPPPRFFFKEDGTRADEATRAQGMCGCDTHNATQN